MTRLNPSQWNFLGATMGEEHVGSSKRGAPTPGVPWESGIWDLQYPTTSLLIVPHTNWGCLHPTSHSSIPLVFHREIVLQELLTGSAGDLPGWEDARLGVMDAPVHPHSRWDIQGNASAFPWELWPHHCSLKAASAGVGSSRNSVAGINSCT